MTGTRNILSRRGRSEAVTGSEPGRRRGRHAGPLVIGAWTVIGVLLLAAFVGPYLLADPVAQNLSKSLTPPLGFGGDTGHVFGTDELGRDELARVATGLRTSVLICGAAALLGATIGSLLGIVGGYFRGLADDVIMRIVDVLISVPSIVTVMLVVSLMGANKVTIILVLSVTSSVVYARVTRAQVISMREHDLTHAIKSLGAPTGRILLRHVLPNVFGSILVIGTLEFASLIVVEASLDYLGLGLDRKSVV